MDLLRARMEQAPQGKAMDLLREQTSQKSFEINVEGAISISFTGYTPDEVKTILSVFRNHLTAMAKMAQETPLPNAFRSTGGGYQ